MKPPYLSSREFCTTLFRRTTGRWKFACNLSLIYALLFGSFFSFSSGAQASRRKPANAKLSGHFCGDPQATLNVNTATIEQLLLLPGVGPQIAKSILASRRSRPFRRIQQIRRVRGIGYKKFRRFKNLLKVSGRNEVVPGKCVMEKRAASAPETPAVGRQGDEP